MELGGGGLSAILATGVGMLAITLLLCVPIVARTLGLAPRVSVGIMSAYYGCMWINDYVLHPLALRSRRGFNAQLVVVPLYNVAFLSSLLLIPDEPRSPLWMGLVLYTGTTASWQEIDRSYAFLAFHTLTPLATIPIFLARGAPLGWSIVGPTLCALLSGVGYHLLAMTHAGWRRVRAEQAATIARLRAEAQQRERVRLAQDLHDAVGSSLGVLGLYADLVERYARDPEQIQRLAVTLRETTREGLGELRGVLDAMAPTRGDLGTLADNLRRAGARAAEATGAAIEVRLAGPPDGMVEGATRLALVRVFQESVANALRHGRAHLVRATLDVPAEGQVRLVVDDDGAGFEPGAEPPEGRGLAGMRRRAEELGGRFALAARTGAGARVEITLPRG